MALQSTSIQVALNESTPIEEVNTEIVIVSGCALGFVAPGKPLLVLHVDQGTEMERHGVVENDILVAIDGKDTKGLNLQDMADALKSAACLTFEHVTAISDSGSDVKIDSSAALQHLQSDARSSSEVCEKARKRRGKKRCRPGSSERRWKKLEGDDEL